MTEYITKEQAINVVNVAFGHVYDSDSTTVCLVDLQNEIIMTIEKNTEPADVAPVVHAEWRYVGSNWECSNCLFPVYSKSKFYRYCPQCGARMDGGENDD